MHWKSRKSLLTEAVEDWATRGLLRPDDARRLQTDIAAQGSGLDFRALVIAFGVICLVLAALTFVAANWDAIPRPGKLGLIGGVVWLAWSGAVAAGWRGAHWWYEGLTLLACGLYGAAIMLVAQIYHIQGEPADAVWLWALGTLIAAALMRAAMPLALATGLFFLWFAMSLERDFATVNLAYLGWWTCGAVLAALLPSRFCGHVSALALVAWVFVSLGQEDFDRLAAMLAVGGALVVVSLMLISAASGRWLRGFEGAALFYTLGLALALTVLLHLSGTDFLFRTGSAPVGAPVLFAAPVACLVAALWGYMQGVDTRYDLWVTTLAAALFSAIFTGQWSQWLTAAFALGLALWITRMGWRLSLRRLRWLGIAGFAVILLIVYAETLGSLMGTAGFYLGAGILLLVGALILPRILRKRAAP